MKECFIYREVTPKKSEQCGCLKKTYAMTTPVHMSTRIWRISQSSLPDEELQAM